MRYDGKEFLESVSKLRRKNTTGILQFGKSVTIKPKSRLWTAVVVNLQPEASLAQESHSCMTTIAQSTVEQSVDNTFLSLRRQL